MGDMPWRSLRATGRFLTKRNLDLRVEGRGHLPESGPVIIASRHFHHFFDGAAFFATIPRPFHPIVTVDWTTNIPKRRALGAACKAAGWPTVIRADAVGRQATASEATRHLRHAIDDSVAFLKAGEIVLIFPEGYPNIDPTYTPKTGDDDFLPFQAGFVRIAEIAARRGVADLPIVPAGFEYRRGPKWDVTLRFGAPIFLGAPREETRARVENAVRALSGLPG